MPKTLIKSRLHPEKQKPKIKQEVNNTKSNLPPRLQSFKKNCFQETVLLNINNSIYTIINIIISIFVF